MRSRQKAMVIIGLPTGSFADSPEQALATDRRVLDETEAGEVKLEGGSHIAGNVEQFVDFDIAVLAYIGLISQKITSKAGFRIAIRTAKEAEQLATDASAIYGAGVFGIVIEGTIEPVATSIATKCSVPPIGIGASLARDGQILVTEYILGFYYGFIPKFVGEYAKLQTGISAAAVAGHQIVIKDIFPLEQQLFWPKKLTGCHR